MKSAKNLKYQLLINLLRKKWIRHAAFEVLKSKWGRKLVWKQVKKRWLWTTPLLILPLLFLLKRDCDS